MGVYSVLLSTRHPGALQHGVQQHIAAGGDVLGRGTFDLVVADAVEAGDEDHAARGQLGHIDRVMSGPRHGRHVGVAQLGRSAPP